MKSEREQTFDIDLERIMYTQEVEGGKEEQVMEGYTLNKKEIMKAWARYRPNFSKNNDMFNKKKRNDDDIK